MSYEIRAMSFAEILDTGFRLVRDHFALLVGIGFVLYAPLAVVDVMLTQVETTGEVSGTAVAVMAAFGLLAALLSPIAQGAMTLALGHVYRGQALSVGEAYRAGLRRALPLMGTFVLVFLGVFVGLLLLVIPGIYLGIAWMLATQVVMLEGLAGPAALGRSRDLLRDNMMRALGVSLVAALIMGVVTSVLQLLLSAIPVVGSLANAVAQAIGLAFYTGVGVVLYFDLRCRKEDFDLEHLARLVEGEGTGPPPIG